MTTEGNICMNLVVLDTDSNYIHFPHLKTAQETWDYAIEVADKVSSIFPKEIVLEFEEEIYAFFLILSKKRYMYRKCLRDGVIDKKIGKKGVLLARRDNSKFVRDVYEQIVGMIANEATPEEIMYFVLQEINAMCSHCKPLEDFVITKAVGSHGDLEVVDCEDGKSRVGDFVVKRLPSDPEKRDKELQKKGVSCERDYYLSCLPAQVQLSERMRIRGQRVDAGTRLEYVVAQPENHSGKQFDKIECAEYFARHGDILRLDYLYYLKALATPLDQVLDVIFQGVSGFSKGFTESQYKLRAKIRAKLMKDIKALGTPVVQFV
jgi:DNA polymerase elongation subunit (family B)